MKTAHLAHDSLTLDGKYPATACGEPWEEWQHPDMPTDEEIGLSELSYSARVALRESDRQRERGHDEAVRQCQACLRVAMTTEGQP